MRSEYKSATQIYVSPIFSWITTNIEMWSFFCIPGPDDQNRWNRKNCPKFFHRVIFAFWFQICNLRSDFKSATQIYVNPIYFELQLILRNDLFLHENRWNWKKCPKFFHRVIFAFWIQICNPNLCKSHIFWITANIKMWSFFAYPDLMTKIDEIEKIARNSFIG